MSKSKIVISTVDVDPERAQYWLENNNYERQRGYKPYHAQYLASQMRQGFHREETEITFGVLNNRHYLVNGQHTLHAIVIYGKPVKLRVEDRAVASREELAKLYASYDRNLPRSHGDIYNAHDFASQHHLHKVQVAALSASMPFIVSGFSHDIRSSSTRIGLLMKSPETRLAHMQLWAPHAVSYFQCFVGASRMNYLISLRAAVAAVGIITMRYQEAKSATFWKRIALDDGLKAGMPERTLLRFLYSNPSFIKRTGSEYSRCVAAAWNHYWEGKELKRIVPRDLTLPIFIAGTPHNGDAVMQYLTEEDEPSYEPTVLVNT